MFNNMWQYEGKKQEKVAGSKSFLPIIRLPWDDDAKSK